MGLADQFQKMADKDAAFLNECDVSVALTICKVGESQFFPIRGIIDESTPAMLFPTPGVQTVNRTATCTIALAACHTAIGRPAARGDKITETIGTQTTIWVVLDAKDDRVGGLVLDLRFEKVNSFSGPNMRKA